MNVRHIKSKTEAPSKSKEAYFKKYKQKTNDTGRKEGSTKEKS